MCDNNCVFCQLNSIKSYDPNRILSCTTIKKLKEKIKELEEKLKKLGGI